MKIAARQKAIKLRNDGYSYTHIAKVVGVSKGTLNKWLSDIPYSPNIETIKKIGMARARSGESKAALKRASLIKAKKLAQADLKDISDSDLLYLGLGLYIGEGEKNDTVGVANTDARVIICIIRWLRSCFGLQIENFTLAVHGYPDTDKVAAENYWSHVTGISKEQFGAFQVDRRIGKRSSKNNIHLYGTAHVRVRSGGKKEFGVLLSRRIQAMSDIVLSKRD